MTTLIYLDAYGDAVEDGDLPTEMFLHAEYVEPKSWNGFAVPVVTAAEFQRYIGALARNDRNSTWSPSGVFEGDGALIYGDECGRDTWSVVGVVDGSPVYALDGWQWVKR